MLKRDKKKDSKRILQVLDEWIEEHLDDSIIYDLKKEAQNRLHALKEFKKICEKRPVGKNYDQKTKSYFAALLNEMEETFNDTVVTVDKYISKPTSKPLFSVNSSAVIKQSMLDHLSRHSENMGNKKVNRI